MTSLNIKLEVEPQANILDEQGVGKKVYNPPVLNVLDVDQTQNPGQGQGNVNS